MTMLTTGYGDGFPETYIGKLISVLSGIIGQVFFSLMLLSFSNFFNMNIDE